MLNTTDDSDIGYFVAVRMTYQDKTKQKSKHFPFASENRKKS